MATLFLVLFLVLAGVGCAPVFGSGPSKAEQESIGSELHAHAWPLVTVDDELDVAPLWEMVQKSRVVGIGMASRGVREFRRITNTLLLRAADEGRPLVLALDIPFYDGLELDAWVRGAASDDAVEAASESDNLFAWIRAHNQSVPPEQAVRVVGLGASNRLCIASLVAYFDAVDPPTASVARVLFSRIESFEAREVLEELRARLEQGRAEYVAARGEEAYAQALRLTWSIGRSTDFANREKGSFPPGEVDRAMADQVVMLSEQMPEARIVVVSRSAHTTRSRPGEVPSMGRLLADRFGAGYAAIHMTFQHGTFLGWQVGRKRRYAQYTGWAPYGTLEDTLHGASRVYALDMRRASAGDGSLASYLQKPRWTRSYPDVWTISREGLPTAWSAVVPATSFDALVYVRYAAIVQ